MLFSYLIRKMRNLHNMQKEDRKSIVLLKIKGKGLVIITVSYLSPLHVLSF